MNFSRRNALKSVAAIGTAGALAAPAIAQERIEWKMVTSWPRNLPGPGITAQRLADLITAMSGGRLTVRLFAAGELVPAFEVLPTVSGGTAEIGHSAPLFWAGKFPAAPVFTAAPFGLTPLEHITWVNNGGGQALWDELYAPAGIKPFMAGNTGYQMGGWYRNEIRSLGDIKGLKIRMPGLGGLVMERLGALPVTVAPGEIFTSLQTGVIDATEFLGPFSDIAMGFHKIAKNYYFPGFHEPNGTGEAIVNLDAWNALPGDLKAIVAAACETENIRSLAESEWENGRALADLQENHGVILRRFPDEVLAAARAATVEVMDELSARDELTARIVTSYRGAATHLGKWSEVSVSAFLAERR